MKTKKKSEKWIIVKFVLILLASGVVGYFSSVLAGYLMDHGAVQAARFGELLLSAVPAIFVMTNVVVAAVSLGLYFRCRRAVRGWDGEDEDQIEEIEQRLSYPVVFANIMMVLNFFFFSATVEMAEYTALGEKYGVILFPVCLLTFVLGYVWIIAVTNGAVKLEKTLNPEKQGNIFDTKFGKDWMNSCDEAEQRQIHECGFRAYKAGSTTCMIMWVLAMFAQLWLETGIYPVACVCIIWLVMTATYMVTSIRLEKGK